MATASATKRSKPRFFINRNFALLWGGQAVSNLGDVVFDTTLMLWVATIIAHNQPWAPLASSGVLLVAAIPTFFFGPIAGVFVDRWDKRRTMIAMDVMRTILVLLLLIASGMIPLPFFPGRRLTTIEQLAAIYIIVFLATICAQFFNPARFALIGDVVAPTQRAHASSLGQITSNMAIVVGPFLAAPLLFVVGVQWALLLNAASFATSFLAISAVRPPVIAGQEGSANQFHFLREMGEGLRFFAQNRVLVTILVSAGIVSFGVGALNTLDIYFVIENLHTSTNLYGLLGTAFGIGSILGAAASALIIKRIGAARTFWLGLIICGALFLIFARQTLFLPALIIFFIIGMPVVAVNTVVGPLLLHVTPRRLVGRVISVFTPAISMLSMLSIVLSGYLASTAMHNFRATFLGLTFTTIDTIFTGMGLLVVIGGIYALVNMRRLHLEEEEKTTQKEVEPLSSTEGVIITGTGQNT